MNHLNLSQVNPLTLSQLKLALLTNDSPPSVFPCTVLREPTVPLSHTLLGIFHLLFTPALISMIAEQTYVYA